jgi:hypothetical protein
MRDSSSSTRGRRLPMLFMLLAMVVATAVVAIGVALGGGGMAGAAPATSGATLVATSFQVGVIRPMRRTRSARATSAHSAVGWSRAATPSTLVCERAARWTRPMSPPTPRAATSPSSGMPLSITGEHNQRTSRCSRSASRARRGKLPLPSCQAHRRPRACVKLRRARGGLCKS